MSKKRVPFQEDALTLEALLAHGKQGQPQMPPRAVAEGRTGYTPLNLLTDLHQKWEGADISTTSGVFLERKTTRKKAV